MILSEELVKSILADTFNIKCEDNLDVICTHMVNFNPESVDFIMRLARMPHGFEPLDINDYCTLPYPEGIEDKFDYDTMQELGLLPGSRRLYGQVIGDTGWSSTYKACHSTLKVNVMVHDDNKKMIVFEHKIDHLNLLKVNRSEIPYYGKNK